MASFARHDFRPVLRDPILIAGLPGVGDVGRIAADLMADQLHARRMARFFSDDLPPVAYVDESCSARAPCHSLWVARADDADVVLLRGECQAASLQGQMSLARDAFEEVLEHDPSLVITLGGCYVDGKDGPPRLLGAVSDRRLKPLFETAGIDFVPGEPINGIAGASGALITLCEEYGVDCLSIVAETSGLFEDPLGAKAVVEALSRILNVEMDTSSLSGGDAPCEEAQAPGSDPPYFG